MKLGVAVWWVAVFLGSAGLATAYAKAYPIPVVSAHADSTPPPLVLLTGVCIAWDSTMTDPNGRVAIARSSLETRPCAQIDLNPQAFREMPPPIRLFVLLHEYGHLVLGHDPSLPGADRAVMDRDASCYALRYMQRAWPLVAEEVLALFREHVPRASIELMACP